MSLRHCCRAYTNSLRTYRRHIKIAETYSEDARELEVEIFLANTLRIYHVLAIHIRSSRHSCPDVVLLSLDLYKMCSNDTSMMRSDYLHFQDSFLSIAGRLSQQPCLWHACRLQVTAPELQSRGVTRPPSVSAHVRALPPSPPLGFCSSQSESPHPAVHARIESQDL